MKKDKIEPLDWEEIILSVGKPVWDKEDKSWRVLKGYRRLNDEFYVSFTDSINWERYRDVKLYLKEFEE